MYLLSNMAMLGIHVSFLVGAISTIIIHPTKVIITADQSPRPNLATKRRQTLATWLGSTSNMAWRKKSDGSKVDSLRAGGPQESVLTEWLGGPYKFGWNNPTYSFFLRLGFVEFFFFVPRDSSPLKSPAFGRICLELFQSIVHQQIQDSCMEIRQK